jgi:hypothetical protein
MLCSTLEVKVFIIITEVLMIHHSYYHGYRKKEQSNSSIPKDFRLPKLYRGVQLHPHVENGTNLHLAPEIRVASCLQPFPNLA